MRMDAGEHRGRWNRLRMDEPWMNRHGRRRCSNSTALLVRMNRQIVSETRVLDNRFPARADEPENETWPTFVSPSLPRADEPYVKQ